ncbi:MAG TPA: hypothetical protein PK993_05365 [Clostridia bacterium]|nr:hypothetical protein [Clostridia bacterium]
MEERSIRVYNTEKTFFSKLSNTLSKMLIPTKIGLNGIMISMKRNNVLKAYDNLVANIREENEEKKSAFSKKYEDTYSLYLDAIDKNIMDSIYKKVKNNTANEFEKNALSKYYMIVHLKENEYVEYKYRKQKYLLELDYESILNSEKEKAIEKYKSFYCSKMESLYKGIIKHYSVKLTDKLTSAQKIEVYDKIFITLEDYITNIFPLKLKNNNSKIYREIATEYEQFETFTIGKLDQNDVIEKNMLLLGISRRLFTHSLPLIVAEQCYIKLLKDLRALIVDTRVIKKQEKAYKLLLELIDEYNLKLLSTKVYWDKPEERKEYRDFWKRYKELEEIKSKDIKEYKKQKEILFISSDLKQVRKNEAKYSKIIQLYKDKLVELGVMRKIPNKFISEGIYTKFIIKIEE